METCIILLDLGPHSGEYGEYYLLGYNTVESCRSSLTFCTKILPVGVSQESNQQEAGGKQSGSEDESSMFLRNVRTSIGLHGVTSKKTVLYMWHLLCHL
jgi:hypothetical protein